MSTTLQIRVDDMIKKSADELFSSLGLDTSTAVRLFLKIAIETGGLPFEVKRPNNGVKLSMQEVLDKKKLSKPYKTAKEAIDAMLED